MKRNQYIDCECQSADHVIRFSFDRFPDEEPELYIEVQLHQHHSFWKRLILATKYILGRSNRFGYWDCTTLNIDTAQQLAVLCHHFRASKENYENNRSRQPN